MQYLAPIVLFTYNRPVHTRLTVEALLKNPLASSSELFVYSDGPKDLNASSLVSSVRDYVRSVKGFKKVRLIEREENYGLGKSIISGVTQVLKSHDRIIVLEDDLVTSPFFLRYMNTALDLYEKEERVFSVHGYVYKLDGGLPDTFFIKGGDCLGWATWKGAWEAFEEDGRILLDGLVRNKLTREFDFDGNYRYTNMLKQQISGLNTSWAIRWSASIFIRGGLTLYPGRSLVKHIGNDGSGTNFGDSDILDVDLAVSQIDVGGIKVAEDPAIRKLMGLYLRSIRIPIYVVLLRRIRKMISSMFKR